MHGEFKITPNHHLLGQGCKQCGREKQIGGYSKEHFEQNPHLKLKKAVLYAVRLSNERQSFIKIGITTRSLQQRIGKIKFKGFFVEKLYQLELSLFDAFNIEQTIIHSFKYLRYYHNLRFHGHTECFKDKKNFVSQLGSYFVS